MSVTVPTIWLALPVCAAVAAAWYFAAKWLMDRYVDPLVRGWIRRRALRDGLTDEQFDEIAQRFPVYAPNAKKDAR